MLWTGESDAKEEEKEKLEFEVADLQQMDDPMEFIERTKNQYPGLNMDDVRLAFEEVKEEVQRLKEEKNMKGKKTKTTEQ
jgi:exonuclease SbcD